MVMSAFTRPTPPSDASPNSGTVVDLHGGRLEDIAHRVRPGSASNLLLWVVVGLFAVALVWAWLTVLDRTVRANGRVIPGAQLQVVSNLEGGIVGAILVRVGQSVTAGMPLIKLDRTETGAAFGASEATMSALSAKIARLEGEAMGREPHFDAAPPASAVEPIAIERSLHASRAAALASVAGESAARISQAQRAVAEAQATYASRRSAAQAASRELDIIRPLVDQGIEPRLSLIQQENQAAVTSSDAAAAAAAIARASASVAEARSAAAQLREDWRAKAADELAAARSEYAARRQALPALASKVDRTIVRAPLDGRINRVLVWTVGGSVRPGDPLIELVPSQSGLLIEATVSPKDIARVRLGQTARVEISAYESAVYGALPGRVVAISPDATLNERTGETHYTVRVVATQGALKDKTGRALQIGPGMVATVSLIGDRRSVLDYLLTPIARLNETAFRE